MTRIRSALRGVVHRSGAQHLRVAAHRLALRMRSGAFRNEVGVTLHADPADQRGTLLAVYRGRLDRSAVATWRRLALEFQPTVAIDVGANYGEVAFSTRYLGLRQLHLVEPNPSVLACLRRTVAAARGDYPELVLHEGAASDHDGTARLNFHEHSGTASLCVPSERGVPVACFRLDRRITLDPDDTLLFKLDVEGHERAALEGMAGLLRDRPAVGICEVMHADDELIDYLGAHFTLAVLRGGVEQPVDAARLREILAQARAVGWGDLSKDVVIRTHASARLRTGMAPSA